MIRTVSSREGEQVGAIVHLFERAGLGKAPFRLIGMDIKKYQACPDAPVQPGGTCAYCGEGLIYCFNVRSSDNKSFMVGCECVRKTDDIGLRKVVDAKARELKRAAGIARQDERIARAKALLPSVESILASQPHPAEHWAKQGQTRLSQVLWFLNNAGRKGQTWAAKVIEDAAKLVQS